MNFLKQRIKNNLQSRSGFTLVELIVVLVILAILAAFTIPAMLGFVEDAKGKAAIAEAREVYLAAQTALTENGASDLGILYKKIVELIQKDIGLDDDKDYAMMQISIFDDGNSHNLIDEVGVKSHIRAYFILGKKGTDQEGVLKEIQYKDRQGNYIIKITPGGSAEVTKIK